jgi:hypothetical protein
MVEIVNDGKYIEFPMSEMDHFIENREVNSVIFQDQMSKDEKINLKLMLEKIINRVRL